MTYEFNQESFWDGTSFYDQSLDASPLDQDTFFDQTPIGLTVSTSSSPQFRSLLPGEALTIPYSEWSGNINLGGPAVNGNFAPDIVQPAKSASSSEERGTGPRRPSAEAVARRRKQNRVSQAAWRARNKELVEELRQEISEYSEYSQDMHETLQSLLGTTESLKQVIESALARKPPKSSQSEQRRNDEAQLMSPKSSDGEARVGNEKEAREE